MLSGMSTKKPGRGPSVKVTEHSTFALELAAYLNELRDGMSGREFQRHVAAGGHDHWAKILAGAKVMTTNDIKVAAEVFNMDPYEFVARAKKWGDDNRRAPVTPIRPNVGPHEEDYGQSEYPDTGRVAAEEERTPE